MQLQERRSETQPLERLRSEAKRETWELGRNEGNKNLDRFTADLSIRLSRLDPPFGEDRRDAVIEGCQGGNGRRCGIRRPKAAPMTISILH